MLLTVDIGNTNIAMGVYKEGSLGPSWRLATDIERMPDEYGIKILDFLGHSGITIDELDGICLASVVPPLTNKIAQACQKYLEREPLIVNKETETGIDIVYDNPGAVGADRIVNAVAVRDFYGCPACVVDFGTATTFDAISADGKYLGGAISPGIGISAEALFIRTAKLPRVDLQKPPFAIGKNTKHSMQSGLFFGYISLVEGMVSRFQKELGPGMKVIATGGLAEVIAKETDCIEFIAPWLTLEGLHIIWQKNTGQIIDSNEN